MYMYVCMYVKIIKKFMYHSKTMHTGKLWYKLYNYNYKQADIRAQVKCGLI